MTQNWYSENEEWIKRAERWRASSGVPLLLRGWLDSPMVWSRLGVTIEGALQYSVVAMETGQMPDDVFAGIEKNQFVDIPIPVCDSKINGFRVAHASRAQLAQCAGHGTRRRRKKTRTDVLGCNKVLLSGGEYKNLDIPISVQFTPYVDFYVLGDKAKLTTLLASVSQISADRSRGVGHVIGWEVTAIDEDRSMEYESKPMRSIPIVDEHDAVTRFKDGSYIIKDETTRAPYWHQKSKTLCVIPVPPC
jgi:hypothetical protein